MTNKINKNDLIKEVSQATGESFATTKKIVNTLCDSIGEHILNGDDVSIKGLVHFYKKEHKAKEVQDFESKSRVKVGARYLPDSRISRAIMDEYKHSDK